MRTILGAALAALLFSGPALATGAVGFPNHTVIIAEHGEKDRSGYGGNCVNSSSGALTGTNASDLAVDAQGCVVPSGTYAASKTWAQAVGTWYNTTLPDGRKYLAKLVSGTFFARSIPTDSSTTNQVRVILIATYTDPLAIRAGETLILRSGSWFNPTNALSWSLSPNTTAATSGWGGFCNIAGGSGYVDGLYSEVPLTGGTGTGATARIYISGGAVVNVTPNYPGDTPYTAGDALSASNTNLGGSGSGFVCTVVNLAARITVQSERPNTGFDEAGNPLRGGSASFSYLEFAGSTYGVNAIPIDFKYVNLIAKGNDNHSLVKPGSFVYGWGVHYSRLEHRDRTEASMGDPEGINTRGSSQTYNYFYRLGQGVVGATQSVISRAGQTIVVGNVFKDTSRDVTVFSGVGFQFTDNIAFNFEIVGGHADCWQHIGSSADQVNFGTYARNFCIRNISTAGEFDAQGIYFDDQVVGTTISNATITHNISSLTHQNQVNAWRFLNPTVKFNTVLSDFNATNFTAGEGNTFNAQIIVGGSTGGDISNNVANGYQLTQTSITEVNNKTVARNLPAYTGMYPNYVNTPLDTRGKVLYSFTPSSTGTASNGDGSYSGVLFPACPTQQWGAYNDASVWDCSNPVWLAAHPQAQ